MGHPWSRQYGLSSRLNSVLPDVPSPPSLSATHLPVAVTLDLPELIESIMAVEMELGARAVLDQNRCRGYFPASRVSVGLTATCQRAVSSGIVRRH